MTLTCEPSPTVQACAKHVASVIEDQIGFRAGGVGKFAKLVDDVKDPLLPPTDGRRQVKGSAVKRIATDTCGPV
jgi:hypothetical protein